jgi:23S rRNA pseudouridine955/2504/2580 synthase
MADFNSLPVPGKLTLFQRRLSTGLLESAPMETGDKPAVRWLDIGDEQAGQRIDNFLLRVLKGVPKSRVYRLLRKGEVRVNKGRIGPDYRLARGDRVRVPPVRVAGSATTAPAGGALARLANSIIYEDERLLILDKPSGMAVHGGSGVDYGVIEGLRALRPDAPFLELVHRLDRDTSGCLMVAKKRSELRNLHDLLRHGGVRKRYLLLAAGNWSNGPWSIDAPLKKNQLSGGERMVQVDDEGKAALTRFRCLDTFPGASLVEADLATGRTHQIRVHAAWAGHPLAGDDKYGDADFNRRLRTLGLKRLFLHAHYLAFDDPQHDRAVEISAPLGDDLRGVIQQLETSPDTGADNGQAV